MALGSNIVGLNCTVSIQFNDGDGNFDAAPPAIFKTGGKRARDLVVEDFNTIVAMSTVLRPFGFCDVA